jgi:hypothetical protein
MHQMILSGKPITSETLRALAEHTDQMQQRDDQGASLRAIAKKQDSQHSLLMQLQQQLQLQQLQLAQSHSLLDRQLTAPQSQLQQQQLLLTTPQSQLQQQLQLQQLQQLAQSHSLLDRQTTAPQSGATLFQLGKPVQNIFQLMPASSTDLMSMW